MQFCMRALLQPSDPGVIKTDKVRFFVSKHRHIIDEATQEDREELGPYTVKRVNALDGMEMLGEIWMKANRKNTVKCFQKVGQQSKIKMYLKTNTIKCSAKNKYRTV